MGKRKGAKAQGKPKRKPTTGSEEPITGLELTPIASFSNSSAILIAPPTEWDESAAVLSTVSRKSTTNRAKSKILGSVSVIPDKHEFFLPEQVNIAKLFNF